MGKFVKKGSSVFTLDTHDALMRVGSRIRKKYGPEFKFAFGGSPSVSWKQVGEDPGPTGMPPYSSMRNTGREVYARIESPSLDSEVSTHILWSIMVPMGFTPWDRYPVPTSTSHIFHFFGGWWDIGDSLQGEGRGEHSWPSMCVASQLEVGAWEGNRTTERSIQAHLHRLGIRCGPIDGIVGDRTLDAIKSLGLSNLESAEVVEKLSTMVISPSPQEKNEKKFGQIFMEGANMRVFNSGSVASKRTNSGFLLTSWGPGVFNVVLD